MLYFLDKINFVYSPISNKSKILIMESSNYLNDGQCVIEKRNAYIDLKFGYHRFSIPCTARSKGFQKTMNTAEVMSEAFNLLQIAEMFYDHMSSSKDFDKNSLPFTITKDVLRKLKSR